MPDIQYSNGYYTNTVDHQPEENKCDGSGRQ